MGKINEARKALLASSLEHAVVEPAGTPKDEPGLDEGYYSVFVPGAVREFNYVYAESEEEAKEIVKANLEQKIDQMAEEEKDNVELKPDSIKKKMAVKVRPATEEEING